MIYNNEEVHNQDQDMLIKDSVIFLSLLPQSSTANPLLIPNRTCPSPSSTSCISNSVGLLFVRTSLMAAVQGH